MRYQGHIHSDHHQHQHCNETHKRQNYHPQHNDGDDKNPEDTPTGKSSVGIFGVCQEHHIEDDNV